MSRTLPLIAALVAIPTALVAQSPMPGLRLFSPLQSTDAFLVDTNGQIVQTWSGARPAGATAYLEANGTLIRAENIPTGPNVAGRGGGIKRIAPDNTVLWDYEYADENGWAHIDFEPMPNGNVLLLVWDRMPAAAAIQAGRDPALLASIEWLPDAVVEVRQTGLTTGEVVWEWHMMDHVIQDFDPSKDNYGDVAANPGKLDINFPATVSNDGEWNHCNAIDYDPTTNLIVISSPFQNEFWIIDHSTTTEQAAGSTGGFYGQGGDILYRWGNPQAYRAGGPEDQKLFFHHSTKFIPPGRPGAGNILVFNNRAGTPEGLNYSTAVEIDLPYTFFLIPGQSYAPADFTWEYREANPTDLYSAIMSSVERMPNGNTLISSAQQGGHAFEVTPSGQKVWEYTPGALNFQCVWIGDNILWSDADEVSVSAGGTVGFDVVAGSEFAGQTYFVIGSMSGTYPGMFVNGLRFPLNFDGYFRASMFAANQLPFGNTLGTLDANGRAHATFTLPGGILPPEAAGLEFHHATAIFSTTTSRVIRVSDTEPLRWTN
ncbi:MAG: aryl-sulfate sulfotransferase [Planctomycetes bacterium]|nr:aryl-sulfate sulfotransferase [Planctomycetota bacterium]